MTPTASALALLLAAMACGDPMGPTESPDHHESMVIESIPYDAIGHVRIAFRRSSSTGSGVVILDGRTRTATKHLARDIYGLEVSPDGSRVAYVTLNSGVNERPIAVNVSDIDSPVQTDLGGPAGLREDPSWTPDGSKVLYREADLTGGLTRIVSQAPKTGANRQILWQASHECQEGIAPHANAAGEIVFILQDCTVPASIVRKKPGQPIEILHTGGGLPAWSPTGAEIAFFEVHQGTVVETYTSDVRVMAADGSNLRTIATLQFRAGSPCWGADGSTLFFLVSGFHESHIYAISALGGPAVPITTQAGVMDDDLTCLR